MATLYVKDDAGTTFIAASQRPDGSWRKQRRVKDGFVPQEEVPLYESKGKKLAKERENALPPGLTPELLEKMRTTQKKKSNPPPVKEDLCSVTKFSPGPSNEDIWITVQTKKKKKGKNQQNTGKVEATDSVSNRLKSLSLEESKSSTQSGKKEVSEEEKTVVRDPVKRLRNLKKRLRKIEALMEMDQSKLSKEQLEKIKRYEEVKETIETMEQEINSKGSWPY